MHRPFLVSLGGHAIVFGLSAVRLFAVSIQTQGCSDSCRFVCNIGVHHRLAVLEVWFQRKTIRHWQVRQPGLKTAIHVQITSLVLYICSEHDRTELQVLSYLPTHTRMGSYIVGVLFGYFMYCVNGQRINAPKVVVWAHLNFPILTNRRRWSICRVLSSSVG